MGCQVAGLAVMTAAKNTHTMLRREVLAHGGEFMQALRTERRLEECAEEYLHALRRYRLEVLAEVQTLKHRNLRRVTSKSNKSCRGKCA
jgi:hypothetical protein